METLYEDEFLIIVNKKAKQWIHPMPGERGSKNCLLFDVRDHLKSRVYAINRLDRPVSGICLFAKNPGVVRDFQEIWHEDTTLKKYLCLHRGKLQAAGKFNSSLSKQSVFKAEKSEERQEALTLYKPLTYFEKEFCTYTEVEIKTGRYHQIRRHFRKAVMPLIGDRKHGKGKINRHFEEVYGLDRIFLHCHQVNFQHPICHKQINIDSPLPENLQNVLKLLTRKTSL